MHLFGKACCLNSNDMPAQLWQLGCTGRTNRLKAGYYMQITKQRAVKNEQQAVRSDQREAASDPLPGKSDQSQSTRKV